MTLEYVVCIEVATVLLQDKEQAAEVICQSIVVEAHCEQNSDYSLALRFTLKAHGLSTFSRMEMHNASTDLSFASSYLEDGN